MSFPNITPEEALVLLSKGEVYALDRKKYTECCVVKYLSTRKNEEDFDKNNIDGEYIRFTEHNNFVVRNGCPSLDMFTHYLNMCYPVITSKKETELLTGDNCALDDKQNNTYFLITYLKTRQDHDDFDKDNIDGEYTRFVEHSGFASREMFMDQLKGCFPNITIRKAMDLLSENIYALDDITYNACCTVKYLSMRKDDDDFDRNNQDSEFTRYVQHNGHDSRDMFIHYLNVC